MSADGGIVLFSSTELPELIGLCDRILVIYQGRLAGEVAGSRDRQPDASAPHQHRRDVRPRDAKWTRGHVMTDTERLTAAHRRAPAARFALPDEIGVIAALVADDGDHRRGPAALPQPDQPLRAARQHHLPRHAGDRHGVPACHPRDRPVGRLDVQFLRRRRRAADGRGLRSVDRGLGRRRLRRRARPRQRHPRGRRCACRPIIVTLGTYSMFQGLSLVVNQGRAIVPADQSSSFFSVISDQAVRRRCRWRRWCSSCWRS